MARRDRLRVQPQRSDGWYPVNDEDYQPLLGDVGAKGDFLDEFLRMRARIAELERRGS